MNCFDSCTPVNDEYMLNIFLKSNPKDNLFSFETMRTKLIHSERNAMDDEVEVELEIETVLPTASESTETQQIVNSIANESTFNKQIASPMERVVHTNESTSNLKISTNQTLKTNESAAHRQIATLRAIQAARDPHPLHWQVEETTEGRKVFKLNPTVIRVKDGIKAVGKAEGVIPCQMCPQKFMKAGFLISHMQMVSWYFLRYCIKRVITGHRSNLTRHIKMKEYSSSGSGSGSGH